MSITGLCNPPRAKRKKEWAWKCRDMVNRWGEIQPKNPILSPRAKKQHERTQLRQLNAKKRGETDRIRTGECYTLWQFATDVWTKSHFTLLTWASAQVTLMVHQADDNPFEWVKWCTQHSSMLMSTSILYCSRRNSLLFVHCYYWHS